MYHKFDFETHLILHWSDESIISPVHLFGDVDVTQREPSRCILLMETTPGLESVQSLHVLLRIYNNEISFLDNNGCQGGSMDLAFEFIKKENGIDTEESYPYEGVQDSCTFKPSSVGATCTGHVDIPSGDEEALKQTVATVGPVSVAIDAHHESFHDYKGGVYDEPECGNEMSDLTHVVLVVGYGTEDGKDYWLVKNGWGESFGVNGYIKMSRSKNNQCGIATAATYPMI
ncbi:cathepsin L [Nephila pilipes]|uniref:Cathepsin L n=1 Tax=Nephila pilipes TaxID=299642 RepID=A0A8X6N4D9_NEPPI|nr:cathepsin L [Nephila pilipes]